VIPSGSAVLFDAVGDDRPFYFRSFFVIEFGVGLFLPVWRHFLLPISDGTKKESVSRPRLMRILEVDPGFSFHQSRRDVPASLVTP